MSVRSTGRWVLAVGLAGALAITAGCSSANRDESAATTELHWGACPPGAPDARGQVPARDPAQQCATLRVPRDYSNPAAGDITVTVSHIATAATATKRGYLLVAPGGPGMPGLDQPSTMRGQLPAEITADYDLVGLDDRGIGNSTPVRCGLADADRDAAVAGMPFPQPDGGVESNARYAKRIADTCAHNAGDYLRDVTTANIARDIDRFRQALGTPKLSYLGTSYGTYRGAVYAQLFPAHTDRIVLDSTVAPGGMQQAAHEMFSQGDQDAFPALAAWLAGQDESLHLGTDSAQVEASYFRITAGLDSAPVHLASGRTLDGNGLRSVVYEAEENARYYPVAAAAFRLATGGTGQDSGTAGVLPTSIPDNFLSDQFAVMCDDSRWPADTGQFPGLVAADKARYPVGNGFGGSPWPCDYWAYAPKEDSIRFTASGPSNILLLQNRHDPATATEGARQTLAAFGSRAAMLTVETTGHGVDFGNACVRSALVAFFATGRLPDDAPVCQP